MCGFGTSSARVRVVYRSSMKAGLAWFVVVGVAGWLTTPYWGRGGGAEGGVAQLGRTEKAPWSTSTALNW